MFENVTDGRYRIFKKNEILKMSKFYAKHKWQFLVNPASETETINALIEDGAANYVAQEQRKRQRMENVDDGVSM